MKVYLLDSFTFSDGIIDVFHYCMFHGEATRKGIEYPDDLSHFLGDDYSDPLVLSRNGRVIPEVFSPSRGLIVSEKVRTELGDISNVVYLKVRFKKLVDFPYKARDFSYYHRPEFVNDPVGEDPETLIARLPDSPRLHRSVGSYYEVVTAWLDYVAEEEGRKKPVKFLIKYLGDDEVVEIPITRSLMLSYPVVRTAHGIMFREDVYGTLSRHIDWDYFSVAQADI